METILVSVQFKVNLFATYLTVLYHLSAEDLCRSIQNFLGSFPLVLLTLRSNPTGGYSQKKWVGVCRPLPKTLTLFMTKICDFPHPIYIWGRTYLFSPCKGVPPPHGKYYSEVLLVG